MQLEVVSAAELALLGMAARAVLARAISDHPAVQSVRLECVLDPSGGSVLDVVFHDRSGSELSGMSL